MLDQVLAGGDQQGEDQGEVDGESLNVDQQQGGLQEGAAVEHEGGEDPHLDSQKKVELTNFSKGKDFNIIHGKWLGKINAMKSRVELMFCPR